MSRAKLDLWVRRLWFRIVALRKPVPGAVKVKFGEGDATLWMSRKWYSEEAVSEYELYVKDGVLYVYFVDSDATERWLITVYRDWWKLCTTGDAQKWTGGQDDELERWA